MQHQSPAGPDAEAALRGVSLRAVAVGLALSAFMAVAIRCISLAKTKRYR